VSKAAVVLLGVLCVLVAAGSYGVIRTLDAVGTDVRRGTLALAALANRLDAVEEELAALSDDVAAIADSIELLAESLSAGEEGEEGEAVAFRDGAWRASGVVSRACTRPAIVRAAERRATRAFQASHAAARAARVKHPCARSRSAGGRSGSSPG
jgi:hypothetical protein